MSRTSEKLLAQLVEDTELYQAAAEENPQSKLTDLLRGKFNKSLAAAKAYGEKGETTAEESTANE